MVQEPESIYCPAKDRCLSCNNSPRGTDTCPACDGPLVGHFIGWLDQMGWDEGTARFVRVPALVEQHQDGVHKMKRKAKKPKRMKHSTPKISEETRERAWQELSKLLAGQKASATAERVIDGKQFQARIGQAGMIVAYWEEDDPEWGFETFCFAPCTVQCWCGELVEII